MTEIPEHLLKRAQAGPREGRSASRGCRAPGGEPAAAEAAADPRIPAHLLERSKAAKAKADGGDRRRWRRRRAGEGRQPWSPPPPAAGGVPVGAGPGGHTQRLLTVVKSGSIQDVKASPVDKVHTWPHLLAAEFVAALRLHGVHVLLLDLRQRPAAAAGQHRTRRRTRRRRRGTSSVCRNC